MVITTTPSSLLRLMQLASVSLPVGGFSFSQGLEYAIEAGWVSNEAQTEVWIRQALASSLARVDLPILQGAMQAISDDDAERWHQWNGCSFANRETQELRLTETAMGDGLRRLLTSLDVPIPEHNGEELSFVCLFAVAAQQWDITFELAAQGFAWSWLENQVAAATKLVPLGQSQAQRLLGTLQSEIEPAIELSATLTEDTLGASLPGLAIASSLHETQYSRLFRS